MKRILLLSAFLPLVCSCDFFRALAGRPTSEEIEAKRQYIQRIEEGHRKRLDSLKNEESRLLDSLSMTDAIRKSAGTVMSAGSLDGVVSAGLEKRYYIMVGTFSRKENARAVSRQAGDRGFEATLITYRNGFVAVGLAGTDDLAAAYRSLLEIRKETFCPKDVWILTNE